MILLCVKRVHIRSYSAPYFPEFGLTTEGYGVYLRVQSESGKIRTRITPNTDTFYKVELPILIFPPNSVCENLMYVMLRC